MSVPAAPELALDSSDRDSVECRLIEQHLAERHLAEHLVVQHLAVWFRLELVIVQPEFAAAAAIAVAK